jgi:hypothetical protein
VVIRERTSKLDNQTLKPQEKVEFNGHFLYSFLDDFSIYVNRVFILPSQHFQVGKICEQGY